MWVFVAWALLKTAVVALGILAMSHVGRRLSDRQFVLVVAILALALRLAWLVAVNPLLSGDAAWYHERAAGLAAGSGFVVDGRPTALFAPIYPIVLSLVYRVTGPSPMAGQVLNLLLATSLVLLTMRLAWLLFGSRVARTAAIVMAVWPGQVPYASVLLSEPLFGVLLVGGMVLLFSRGVARWAQTCFLTGLLLGAATLVKAPALGFVALVPAMAWLVGLTSRRALAGAALAVVGLALVLAPWAWRNSRQLGAFVPLTTASGIALWDGNRAGAIGQPSDAANNPFRKLTDEVARDRAARREALQFIREHPGVSTRLYFRRLQTTYETDTEVAAASLGPAGQTGGWPARAFLAACTTWFNAMMLLFLAFLAQQAWRWRYRSALTAASARETLSLVLPVAYFAASQAVFLSQYRYNFASLPFVAIAAAAALVRAADRVHPSAGTPVGQGFSLAEHR